MSVSHQKRRNLLHQSFKDGLIVMTSAPEILRNGDVHHYFRQDSHFLYATGIDKPNYRLVLDPKAKKSYLFIPDYNLQHQVWEGRQLTKKQAKKKFQPNHVYFLSEWNQIIKKLSKPYRKVYLLPATHQVKCQLPKKLRADRKQLKATLDQMRLKKSAQEIRLMQKANDISKSAHVAAMKATKPGMREYQVQAVLDQEFTKAGAMHKAYHAIVAAGPNAAILHYHENTALCKKGDLLLIDAGCEWQGYASDITRTFPISGKFSKKQKDIYNVVLNAHQKCIKAVKPGISLGEIHILSCKLIVQGLAKLGFFKSDNLEEIYESVAYRLFYPHGIGHLLGLDVHDVGAKKKRVTNGKTKGLRSHVLLKPGMVITIEPGVYFIDAIFSDKAKKKKYGKWINWSVAQRYKSVGGIRIEDDVLVTQSGHRNLTKVPTSIHAIEKLMRSRSR